MPCNNGTGKSDQVAALLGRIYPDAVQPDHQIEVRRLFRAVGNNCPGLLEEMEIGRAGQKLARKRLSMLPDAGGGFLRVGGPLVTHHMQIFAVKLGFALWFEATKAIVPSCGGVLARWFSNVDELEGAIPPQLFNLLGDTETLRQGVKQVGEQF